MAFLFCQNAVHKLSENHEGNARLQLLAAVKEGPTDIDPMIFDIIAKSRSQHVSV